MNFGALKEGVNIWSFRIYLSLEALMHYEHLQTCGTLKSWKQVKDQFRNPKGFGFAEYADADSVLMAKINTDENTRKYLDQYEASKTVL
ncbi:unnamed protein product [Rhizophagus irregularis]|nr:unnamed protein product [Rhizophagus irregularis]